MLQRTLDQSPHLSIWQFVTGSLPHTLCFSFWRHTFLILNPFLFLITPFPRTPIQVFTQLSSLPSDLWVGCRELQGLPFFFKHLLVLWPLFWVNIEKAFNWISYLHSSPTTLLIFSCYCAYLPCRTNFAKNDKLSRKTHLVELKSVFCHFPSTLAFFIFCFFRMQVSYWL